MELRLLTNETERRIFAARTEQIRAKHGVGFKERPRSRLARIHLTFGNLYALFENDDEPAEKMIAGLVMHDLEMFPQTCPRPDLSHLPPRSVLEVSELWSRAIGAGALARCGAAILAGLLDARDTRVPGREAVRRDSLLSRDRVRQRGRAGRVSVPGNAQGGIYLGAADDPRGRIAGKADPGIFATDHRDERRPQRPALQEFPQR